MAFTDPITVTINSVAKTMPLISRDGQSAFYQTSDQVYGLSIRHTNYRKDRKDRVRTLVVLTQRKVVPDPLTAVNDYETISNSWQLDRPLAGFVVGDIDLDCQGFKAFLSTANVTKLFARES